MSVQKSEFLRAEGDRWFERNFERLGAGTDLVLSVVERLNLKPKDVLEIGCSNGWRLEHFASRGATCHGIDPSAKAVGNNKTGITLQIGTADKLPYGDNQFDLVLFGFCFYLIDPALHFKCIAEADRVLRDGGTMVMYDFITPRPYYNDYAHLPGLRAHKMEFSRYIVANPAYSLVHREIGSINTIDDRIGVDVLVKDQKSAFTPNPF